MFKKFIYIFILIFILFVFITTIGLFFIDSSKTTIVLLNNKNKHNMIIVSTSTGSSKLDKTGSFVDLKTKEKAPDKPKIMSKKEISRRFSKVMAASPKKAISYILYFKPRSTELTEASKEVLLEALKSMKKRAPCIVDILGHTDTVGSEEINKKVSLKRAKHVESILKKRKIKVVALTARGYGEEDLLVNTPDNTAETKNRNVEIFIK